MANLSGTLNKLLRAQHGSALDDVEDSELDKKIAAIMVADAKERQKQWGTMGFTAYLDELDEADGPSRKTNKRFLASMIRNVDTHNQALIRQELESAQTSQESRRRDDRSRLFGSAMASAARRPSDKGKGRAVDSEERLSRHSADSSVGARDEEDRDYRRSRDHRRPRRDRDDQDSEDAYERDRQRRKSRHRDEQESDDHYEVERDRRDGDRHRDERDARHSPRENGRSSSYSHRSERSRRHREERSSRHRIDHDYRDRERRHRSRSKDRESTEHRESRRSRSPRDSNRGVDPDRKSPRETSASVPERNPVESTESIKPAKAPAKHSRAQLQAMHPTELFMLTGGTSIEPSPSPPPEAPRKRKYRPPSPVARVRVSSHDEDDPGPGIRPPPEVVPDASSKMDKYFHAAYDPKYDVNFDDCADPVTGFVKAGAYDDWEIMREVQKAQREYKKEKGMREAEERFQALEREAAKQKAKQRAAEEEKDRKRRRKLGINSDEDEYGPQPPTAKTKETGYTAPAGPGMFGYRYVKKGGTREWDLGKETPT